MKFRNKISDEILTHLEFVKFIWEESERQFSENTWELWCNLTLEEQLELYCYQYEHQLQDRDWEMIYNEKENN